METPRQKNATETLALISMFFEKHCQLHDGRNLVCAHCGGEIRCVRGYMSLHDAQHGDACVGPARAWRLDIPYCVACEKPPSRYGCIHMSAEELNLPAVVEASRPFGADQMGR